MAWPKSQTGKIYLYKGNLQQFSCFEWVLTLPHLFAVKAFAENPHNFFPLKTSEVYRGKKNLNFW